MTPNEIELLRDAHETCIKVMNIVAGMTFDDYLRSELHQYSVNWQVVIIGEALNVPDGNIDNLGVLVPSARQAIATRHRIAHGYRTIDKKVMRDIAIIRIPRLRIEIETQLDM